MATAAGMTLMYEPPAIIPLEPGTRVRLYIYGHGHALREAEGFTLPLRFGQPAELVNPCWFYPVWLADLQGFRHIPAEDPTGWQVAA